jgi:pyruvate/2-oxoacid:ferredoxin oxidoreductase alpha subunit
MVSRPGMNLSAMMADLLQGRNEIHKSFLYIDPPAQEANIRKNEPEALANTKRLREKLIEFLPGYTCYDWQKGESPADVLIVSWGITAEAVRDAKKKLDRMNNHADVLIVKTLLPVSEEIKKIINGYSKVVIAEENLTGQYKEILFGENVPANVKSVNKIGDLITPDEITDAVLA